MCFVRLSMVFSVMLNNFLSNNHPITNHQSVSNWCDRHQTHMYTFTYRHVPTNTCHTPTRRGPDYVSPLTIQGSGGRNWLGYQTLIQNGGTHRDLQDHPFIIETTAGEDIE